MEVEELLREQDRQGRMGRSVIQHRLIYIPELRNYFDVAGRN